MLYVSSSRVPYLLMNRPTDSRQKRKGREEDHGGRVFTLAKVAHRKALPLRRCRHCPRSVPYAFYFCEACEATSLHYIILVRILLCDTGVLKLKYAT